MPYALHFFVIILTAVICEVIYQRIRYNIHQKRRSALMKKKSYCYSFDNEHFHNDDDLDNAKTQEEAEAIAQQLMQDNNSDNIMYMENYAAKLPKTTLQTFPKV